jgi:hypothetical protein
VAWHERHTCLRVQVVLVQPAYELNLPQSSYSTRVGLVYGLGVCAWCCLGGWEEADLGRMLGALYDCAGPKTIEWSLGMSGVDMSASGLLVHVSL